MFISGLAAPLNKTATIFHIKSETIPLREYIDPHSFYSFQTGTLKSTWKVVYQQHWSGHWTLGGPRKALTGKLEEEYCKQYLVAKGLTLL
jgi:hypothetical protein